VERFHLTFPVAPETIIQGLLEMANIIVDRKIINNEEHWFHQKIE